MVSTASPSAARRSYIDAFLPFFLGEYTDFQLRPRYWDYQAKWVPKLARGIGTSLLFVYGSDDLN